jgi:hypothetical protein
MEACTEGCVRATIDTRQGSFGTSHVKPPERNFGIREKDGKRVITVSVSIAITEKSQPSSPKDIRADEKLECTGHLCVRGQGLPT